VIGFLAAFLVAASVAPQAPNSQAPAAQRSPATAASPQDDSVLEARTAAVASQLRCPVCQGLSIQDSPSELSQQMRSVVKDQLREGKTPEQVKAYFISKYGEWILLEPKASGFNVLVYALPILLVAAGLAVIVVAVRRWTRPPDAPA
jgi:cytochrome c-type biogenesis protein CcmH